jgi:cbb3-type cytochrome oxidase maturation protein
MSVILVLVAFSVTLAVGFLIAFFWSVKNGQYDDTYSSSVRILFEDDKPDEVAETETGFQTTLKDQSPNN